MKKKLLILLILSTISNYIFAQHAHEIDSTKNILLKWQLPDMFNADFQEVDTTQIMLHKFEPQEKQSIASSNLGNIGSATYCNIFSKRNDLYNIDYSFITPYRTYMILPENVSFFDTRKPFSEFFYSTASKVKDEMTMRFTHSQNITPLSNFGLKYNLIASKGQYLNEGVRQNSLALTYHYRTQSNKYSLQSAFIYNKFILQDNGGLIDTANVDIKTLEANLSDAQTVIYNRSMFISQKYNLGKIKKVKFRDSTIEIIKPYISINHNFKYNKQYRVYKDAETSDNGYYGNYFLEPTQSYDSTVFNSFSNTLMLQSESIFEKKMHFKFNLALSNIFKNFYNFKDYPLNSQKEYYMDNKFSGLLSKRIKNIEFLSTGNIYFTGYRMGDFRLNFITNKYFKKDGLNNISLKLQFTNQKPSYYIQSYYSNHYRWENNFNKSQTAEAFLNFNFKSINLFGEISATLLENYVYFGAIAVPQQYDQSLSVFSAKISKNFHLGRVHFFNKLIWQKSNNDDIISLPELSAYHATYIQVNYKEALKTHIGFEIYYTTAYKAMSYNPGIGNFFYENSAKTGNYPFITVFLNAKIKKTFTLFLKYEHANSGIFKEIHTEINHYPLNISTFKFGVRWQFFS